MPHLSIRHQSRIIVLQSLYEWDFDHTGSIQDIVDRNISHSGFKVDQGFAEKVAIGTVTHREEIDALIERTAPEWPLNQIAAIDRAILRMGIFELIFDYEVPPKAVINEAVELGKSFGGENTGKFINGVLGTIYRSSDRYEKEEILIGGGAIVYCDTNKEPLFLLVKNSHGKWTFPKTMIKDEETWLEAAQRAVFEKTDIEEVEVIGEVGELSFTDKSEENATKNMIYFYLIKADKDAVSKTRDDQSWASTKDVERNLDYPNLIDMFKKALELLKNK